MNKAKQAFNDFQAKLKKLWDENPVIVLVLGIATANAGSRLIQANSQRRNSKAWDRETKRRVKADKKKP
jgi:hypothetical protein